jgi:lipopolysaccharide export system protein LptA
LQLDEPVFFLFYAKVYNRFLKIASVMLCLVVLTLGTDVLYAQVSDSTAPKLPIILRNADSLVTSSDGVNTVRELMGNVHLEQGNVTVYCDHAMQYISENRVVLDGNVKIIQGTVTMLMPRGEYYGNLDIAQGEGGVKIIDRKTTLTARRGVYSTKSTIARFYEKVVVEDDSVRIHCDSLRYFRSTQDSYTYGNVVMRGKQHNVVVYGDSARNIPKLSYSVVRGRPLLYQIDSVRVKKPVRNSSVSTDSLLLDVPDTSLNIIYKETKSVTKKTIKRSTTSISPKKNIQIKQSKDLTLTPKTIVPIDSIVTDKTASIDDSTEFRYDTLSIFSDVLESFRTDGERRFITKGNVEITRRTIFARGEFCEYDDLLETIMLEGKKDSASKMQPALWADSMQIHADSIMMYVPKKKLTSIDAWYSSFMVIRNDTFELNRSNQISGDALFIRFADDTIRSVRSVGNAQSLYFMNNEQGPDGVSRTTCDSLRVRFEKGELEDIVWKSGVHSEYSPQNLVESKTETFYLPSYKWREDKPIKPEPSKRILPPEKGQIPSKKMENDKNNGNESQAGKSIPINPPKEKDKEENSNLNP